MDFRKSQNSKTGLTGKTPGIFNKLFRHQYVLLVLVVCLGVAISVALFILSRNDRRDRLQLEFNSKSDELIEALRIGIEESLQQMEALAAFYVHADMITRKEFHAFVQPFMRHNPAVQALAWVPRVPYSRRAGYESAARQEGLPGFELTELKAQGGMTRAGKRREYFPAYFVEPYSDNKAAFGFDIASDPTRRDALQKSSDNGTMVVISGSTLVQKVDAGFLFTVFHPLYGEGAVPDSLEARRERLSGYVAGVFSINGLIEKYLSYLDRQNIAIRLYDETSQQDSRLLYAYPPSIRTPLSDNAGDERAFLRKGVHYDKTIEIAGRKWTFLATPAPGYLAGRRYGHSWDVLGGGLVITGLLTAYILSIMKRTSETKRFTEQAVVAKEELESEIATRIQSEKTLRASENRYHSLFDNMLEGFAYCQMLFEDGRPKDFVYIEVNAAFEGLTGLTNVIGKKVTEVIPGIREAYPQLFEIYGRVSLTGKGEKFEIYLDPLETWLSVSAYSTEKQRFIAVFDNITNRKQRERELESISRLSIALRSASTRADQFPLILVHTVESLDIEAAAIGILEPATGETLVELGWGELSEWTGRRLPPGEGVLGHVITGGKAYSSDDFLNDSRIVRPEAINKLNSVACVPLIAEERTIGAIMIGCRKTIKQEGVRLLTAIGEIAAIAVRRLTLHEQALQQMHHLQALHEIDIAISSSLDMRVTLNVLLAHVSKELQADAAAVLLLNPHSRTLTYAAGHGFRTRDIEQSRIKLGEGCAGRAALERTVVSVPEAVPGHTMCAHVSQLTGERFVSHHVAPLVIKGQVKGVLEVLNRRPLTPDKPWLEFFEALAQQAAIAIDMASLFGDLQHANDELALAYDATIEGWSRALDLRDKETEGHSRRVTDMTVKIAREMGTREDMLVHIRRGSLLHDIGKMGIPDHILLKPGKLSEEEWIIMRKHPVFAHDLLSPIAFLRPALDIPLRHHEKWDGTGYPEGLKGEKIPLAARIFSVVDVWDALSSDRPYRPAWSKENVMQYLRDKSEVDFDPSIAALFIRQLGYEA